VSSRCDKDREWPWERLPAYPERPYVPPLMFAMVVLVVFENLVLKEYATCKFALALAVVGFVFAAACFAAAHAVALRRGEELDFVRPLLVVASLFVCACVACAAASLALAKTDAATAWLAKTSVSSCSIEVMSDPSETQGGWMSRGRVTSPAGDVAIVWLTASERLSYGERVRCVGRFSANDDDDWGVSSKAQGLAGRVKAVRFQEREKPGGPKGLLCSVRERCLAGIEPSKSDARALLAGITVGERAEAKACGISDDFAAAGLSHLIAVSGSHLAVVATMLESVLLAFGLGPRARSALAVALTGGYVVLCACPSSAVRAWVMLVAARSGKLLGRRAHAPSGVALAGIGMCLLNPGCAAELGFQLSVLSVCALALFSSHMEAMLARLSPSPLLRRAVKAVWKGQIPTVLWRLSSKAMKTIRSTLAASLVCLAATMPLSAIAFGRVSLVGPLANLIVGPLFAPVVTSGALACAFLWAPIVGAALMAAASVSCWLVLVLVRAIGSIPFASLPVSIGEGWELAPIALAVVLLVVWPKPSRRQLGFALGGLAAFLSLVLVKVIVFAPASVTVLDVGQGDAILIRQGPHAMLVDTGPADAVLAALARNNVYHLDAALISHMHDDHYGGLCELKGLVGCDEVFVGWGVSDDLPSVVETAVGELTGSGAEELRAGESLKFGDFRLTCLWPAGETNGSENEDSVCLLLTYDSGGKSLSMLLTGDAESDSLEEVASEAGDIDVLKVGHHGSKVSINEAEATELKAEVSVASAGKDNSYGHPTQECIDVLEASGSKFLCTINTGDVQIFPGAAGVRVRCQRNGEAAS
jgi:competence protein ComEC